MYSTEYSFFVTTTQSDLSTRFANDDDATIVAVVETSSSLCDRVAVAVDDNDDDDDDDNDDDDDIIVVGDDVNDNAIEFVNVKRRSRRTVPRTILSKIILLFLFFVFCFSFFKINYTSKKKNE